MLPIRLSRVKRSSFMRLDWARRSSRKPAASRRWHRPARVLWAGLSPALVGVQQVNIQIPSGVPSSTTVALQFMMFGEMGAPYALAVR